MKIFKLLKLSIKLATLGLLLLALGLFAAPSVNAQTEVITEPAQITVVGMRGTVVTRNIFLRTATPVTQLELIPLDLNSDDGGAVLSAQAISLEKSLGNLTQPNAIISQVKFDLRKVNSGEFNGKLRLSYKDGEWAIPVTVKVKEHWFLPLFILLIGAGLGVSVSLYRAQGRPRDEILVRVSQLRVQTQDDADLSKFKVFQSRVDSQLIDVKMALQGELWDEAQNAVKQAELVINRWLKGRGDWLAQLDYYEEIKQRLQDMDDRLPFVQAVVRSLEDALRDAPDLESPVKLRDRLQEIAEQVNSYIPLEAKMKQLISLNAQLSVKEAKSWQPKVQNLEQRMGSLQPGDLAKDANLGAEVEGAIAEITELLSQQEDMLDPTEVDFGVNVTGAIAKGVEFRDKIISLLGPPPSARLLSWEEQASSANLRLKVFTVSSYIIAIVFLAGAGFSQLYLDKPTFGDNPWKDYFALMAWGFGAEATRDAVTKVAQGGGLPGLK
ncbi:hypothetical protein QUB56_14150 [Microcoleus sp. AR_TQ3_B6]|uniref:hypothetical protein n=1 Tax=Microcoleus sp. AR_TQ3_B6 TaxID=3055284 RepID=UPI002FD0E587